MNVKFYTLIALALLPWLYVGADVLFDFASRMNGFGYLPFFALLLLKEKVINPPGERTERTVITNPYLRYALVVVVALFLTISYVLLSSWTSDIMDMYGKAWLWILFLAFIIWNIRQDYRSIRRAT